MAVKEDIYAIKHVPYLQTYEMCWIVFSTQSIISLSDIRSDLQTDELCYLDINNPYDIEYVRPDSLTTDMCVTKSSLLDIRSDLHATMLLGYW